MDKLTCVSNSLYRTVTMAVMLTLVSASNWVMPSNGNAGTFWTDDFESGLGAWSLYDGAGPGSIELVNGEAHSGVQSLRMHYVDLNTGQGPFMDRYGPRTTNMFVRAWVKMSPGFSFSPSATKLSYSPRGDTYPSCLLDTYGSPQITLVCQGVPNDGSFAKDFVQNASASISTSWHCIEWQVDYGSVGQANGAIRVWWDDNLVLQRTGIYFLSQFADMYLVRMYRERGLGDLYWDDFSVGDSRQGCSGSGTATDQPPGPPASPRIQSVTAN
jgi:hypothetical protein